MIAKLSEDRGGFMLYVRKTPSTNKDKAKQKLCQELPG
jgi:hypothetical protein